MAVVAWVNLGVGLVLAVACVLLYLDGKGARKALGSALVTLQRQTAAHDAQLAAIGCTLARLAPAAAPIAGLPLASVDGAVEPVAVEPCATTARTGTPVPPRLPSVPPAPSARPGAAEPGGRRQ